MHAHKEILHSCEHRKFLPYFYVKILHQKNVIIFFKWDFFRYAHCIMPRDEFWRKLSEKKSLKNF